MVGAGLPDLRVRLLAAKPYADRLFSYAELGSLSEAAARSALVGPAAAAGVDYDEAAARQIVSEAAGFPYFIQEYGRELWNYAESTPITCADLDAARVIVKDSLARNFFGTRFEMATDTEQRYLSAMASLGPRAVPGRRSRPGFRRRRPAQGLGASGVTDPEGPHLEPPPWSGRLHGAAVCRFPEGQPSGFDSLDNRGGRSVDGPRPVGRLGLHGLAPADGAACSEPSAIVAECSPQRRGTTRGVSDAANGALVMAKECGRNGVCESLRHPECPGDRAWTRRHRPSPSLTPLRLCAGGRPHGSPAQHPCGRSPTLPYPVTQEEAEEDEGNHHSS